MIEIRFTVYVSEWNDYKDWIESLGYERPHPIPRLGDQWVSGIFDEETASIIKMKYRNVVIGETS
jgi:hypothetical protein